jgi:hypothetical protein
MALQGNLRDFSVSEILQLLGTQSKTGCLVLKRENDTVSLYVSDGRLVSARDPGMKPDDPLIVLLRGIHRLPEEQYRGLLTIHRETGRDVEDLLLNGRYMEQDDLAAYVERQILDTLLLASQWNDGSYRFDPSIVWKGAKLVRLSCEGVLIEAARRMDELKRYRATFPDAHRVLGVLDLPDPDEPLSDEERELFGIIDGQHTLAEICEGAPLTEYETLEALYRMKEEGWIELLGRKDPGTLPAQEPQRPRPTAPVRRAAIARELLAAAVAFVAVAALFIGGHFLTRSSAAAGADDDVFVATQMRDLRKVLDLYRREHGAYPQTLDELVSDRWLSAREIVVSGHRLRYEREDRGADYRLQLERLR